MKNFLSALAVSAVLVSCSKKEATPVPEKADTAKIVDSINAARTKINDSIRSKNHFKDFSGTHTFTHNSIKNPGSVHFEKIKGEADHYNIKGDIKSGKSYVHIDGFMAVVSDKHMNFTGNISESVAGSENGKPYVRRGTKTFMSKDGGKTYRLQDMVNGSGFVEYIDIHF